MQRVFRFTFYGRGTERRKIFRNCADLMVEGLFSSSTLNRIEDADVNLNLQPNIALQQIRAIEDLHR
jgi:hypothetical protein